MTENIIPIQIMDYQHQEIRSDGKTKLEELQQALGSGARERQRIKRTDNSEDSFFGGKRLSTLPTKRNLCRLCFSKPE
jgi:hypothetical protein